VLFSCPTAHLRARSIIVLEVEWLELALDDLRRDLGRILVGPGFFLPLVGLILRLLDCRELCA
jgi:hypothetical protein